MKSFSHLWQHFAEFYLEWKMFQTIVVYKIKIHILCSVWDNFENFGGASEVADDNMAARCMLY
jgi:hypothetical protein